MKARYLLKRFMSRRRINRINFKKRGINLSLGQNVLFKHPENIVLGSNVKIDDNCSIQTWPIYREFKHDIIPDLTIGNDVTFMRNCQVSCINKIRIGNGCLFGDNVFVTDNFHGELTIEQMKIPPIERKLYSKGAVIIGDNVWIGRNVCVMPNVKIGNGAIIGANSVVTKDVEENSVVAGCPAKVIRVIQ